MSNNSITNAFNEHFRLVQALDPSQKEAAFHIRYQVYCKEFGFKSEQECPGQIEQDNYDTHSRQCLLIHKSTGLPAGCVRLVMARRDHPEVLLPFEVVTSEELFRDVADPDQYDRLKSGEISRLIVPAMFRRRDDDDPSPVSFAGMEKSRLGNRINFPLVPVGLFVAAIALGRINGLERLYAMMEPRLSGILARFGFEFVQIGKEIDYRGFRGPFMIDLNELDNHLREDVLALLDDTDRKLRGTKA